MNHRYHMKSECYWTFRIETSRFGGVMGMAYFALSYTKYRHGSTTPPKSSPFSEGKDLKPGWSGLYLQTSARPYGVARDCLPNRKLTLLTLGCARQSIRASLMFCSRWHESCDYLSAEGWEDCRLKV